jgi:SAM-dependent methyltransferase
MDIALGNKEFWQKVNKRFTLMYPNERVVAFLARNFKDFDANSAKNALDVGFGNGRHLKLLSDYNFNVYGVDYDEDAVETCRKRFADNTNIRALYNKALWEMEDGTSFDAVIAYGVLFLASKAEMIAQIKNIFGRMKSGGKLAADFRTKEDFSFAKGEQLDSNTYRLDGRAGGYANLSYSYYDIEELKEILSSCGFEVARFERTDYWKANLAEHHSWWNIEALKA